MTRQRNHYANIILNRRRSRAFSCGYYERFDPFLLDRKPFLRPAYERLFQTCFPQKVGTIVDMGCGTGLYWPVLRQHCERLIGVDASPEMIAEADRLVAAKSLTGVQTLVRPLETLRLPGVRVDAVVSIDALHHVDEPALVVASIAELLRPGGRMCVLEPNVANPLVLLAHLLPAEERRAVARNFPPVLRARFAGPFQNIRTEYLNFVASASSTGQVEFVARIDRLLGRCPWLRPLSLRQLLTMERR